MKLDRLLFAFIIGMTAAPAHASLEVGYAYIDEIDGESSHGFVGSWVRPIERWRAYNVHTEVVLVGIVGRDEFPSPDDSDVVVGGVGLRKHVGGFFIGAALGLASQKTEFLSTSHQLVSSLGYARGSWVVAYRHISNANTGGHNDGENLLSLSFRW